eukprot:scaffold121035_cov19-Tisochrysis_lutea.AAC.1
MPEQNKDEFHSLLAKKSIQISVSHNSGCPHVLHVYQKLQAKFCRQCQAFTQSVEMQPLNGLNLSNLLRPCSGLCPRIQQCRSEASGNGEQRDM